MFTDSCTNFSINRGILQADCHRKNGDTRRSKIDLDRFVANDNGSLVVRPNGNFSKTCSDITFSDGVLHCLAQQSNGNFRQASQLNLNNFIQNNDGNLEWSNNSVLSSRYSVNNGVLHAETTMANGSLKRASISLDDWIGNNDGQLIIRRGGDFSRSCSAISVDNNGKLKCRASRCGGDEVPVEMDLKQFVKNDNGELQWIPDISSWDNNFLNTSNVTHPSMPTTTAPFSMRCNPVNPHQSAFCTPSTSIR